MTDDYKASSDESPMDASGSLSDAPIDPEASDIDSVDDAGHSLDALAAPVSLPESSHRKARKPSTLRSLVEWILVVGLSLGVALLIQAFLFQPFRIPSGSMKPTLRNGDRIVVNKLSYRMHDVRRGDVVVFTRPMCEKSTSPAWANCVALEDLDDLVKRVVGVSGDTVFIANDTVFINGRALTEPYLNPGGSIVANPYGCGFTSTKAKPYVVPKDMSFVMGDNRNDSIDSRCFGPIKNSTIVGRAFVRIWPPQHLGGL